MLSYVPEKKVVAGVDEAGRGSWAGPVVSAAVVLGSFTELRSLKDSKALTRGAREVIFNRIKKKILLGIGFASVKEIEDFNIQGATFLSMPRCQAISVSQL